MHHPRAHEMLTWWTWDPLVWSGLFVIGALYARGVTRLWRRAGAGHGVRPWQVGAFIAGWLTLVIALLSPLDRLSDFLFSAHMSQHELLMLVAAPLLVLGRSLYMFVWAFSDDHRQQIVAWCARPIVAGVWRRLTNPFIALGLHAVALWIWHIPALFEAALGDERIHAVQHASFFFTAALFFWALVHGRYGRAGYGASVLYVFVTAVHSSILGALLTVAGSAWYPAYDPRTRGFGVDPLADQQLAGIIMWVPAGLIFIVVGLALFAAWIGESERRVAKASRA